MSVTQATSSSLISGYFLGIWKQKAPTSSATRSYTPKSETPSTVTDQANGTPPTKRSNKSKEKSFVSEEHGTLEGPGGNTQVTIGQRTSRQRRKRGHGRGLRSFLKRKFHQLRTSRGLDMQVGRLHTLCEGLVLTVNLSYRTQRQKEMDRWTLPYCVQLINQAIRFRRGPGTRRKGALIR